MRWWPFHRRKRRPPASGDAARQAKREAQKAVRDAQHRAREIQQEMDTFVAQVEAALSRRRR